MNNFNNDSENALIRFDNQKFIKVMNMSKRIVLKWIGRNCFGLSQLGNKIYYISPDINVILNANCKPKK
jgi:hypothetical protein